MFGRIYCISKQYFQTKLSHTCLNNRRYYSDHRLALLTFVEGSKEFHIGLPWQTLFLKSVPVPFDFRALRLVPVELRALELSPGVGEILVVHLLGSGDSLPHVFLTFILASPVQLLETELMTVKSPYDPDQPRLPG